MTKADVDQLARRVGRAIARRRNDRQLTQEEVAERLGIGYEAVSRIERGLVIPTVRRLAELANIFECDIAELLTESSNRSLDQAAQIASLLSTLSNDDRQMILEIVGRLGPRLGRK
jgi:transcriptional regulator with XRE-family HTH domain